MRARPLLTVCFAGVLLASACSGSSDGDAVEVSQPATIATDPPATDPPATEPPATDPPVTEPPATDPPATDPPATEPPATEPPATDAPAGPDAIGRLSERLAAAPEVTTYRVRVFQSQRLVIPGVVDQQTTIDPDRPTTVVEVADAERSSNEIDVGLLASNPELDVTLRLWSEPGLVTVDTTEYAQLPPVDDLGLFAPGLFTIDLGALGAVGETDVARLLGATTGIDLAELSRTLPQILDAVVADTSDPVVFRATTTFTELTTALGGDIEDNAISAAAGVAATLGVDGQALAEVYIDLYDTAPVDVTIVLGDDGLLERLDTVADLSALYTGLIDANDRIELGIPPSELDAAAELFGAAEFELRQRTEFEADDSIVYDPPTDGVEDRTALAPAFFRAAGIDL